MSWFPINTQYNRGIPINSHPGAFGCVRKYDIHTGIDLYGKEEHSVYAINDGVVVKVGNFTGDETTPWWLPTDAIIIKSDTEYYVYGELKPNVVEGQIIKSGSRIGELIPVLLPEKIRSDIPKHSNVMLHLEKYDLSYDISMGWANWITRESRPSYLLDPTNDLISILQKAYRKVELLTL